MHNSEGESGVNKTGFQDYLKSKLNLKIVFATFSVIIILFTVQTAIIVPALRDELMKSQAESIYNLSEIIKNSTRYSMMLNSKDDVNEIFRNITGKENINSIKLYDKEGNIRFSDQPGEINKSVSIKSINCSPCHISNTPLSDLKLNDRTRIIEENGIKFLLLLNPVKNDPGCSQADCHVSEKESKLLGILEVKVSLSEVDRLVQKNVQSYVSATITGAVFISLLTSFLVSLLIVKPVKRITDGIKQIAAGNLKYKIDIKRDDEFGEMAIRFNEMSEKLSSAHDEIKNLNENLNFKINEKSEELKNIYSEIMRVEKLASLGALSATVAHELNNPLAGILNFSKLIEKKLKKQNANGEFEELIGYLCLISEESARCGRIVKDLLSFSKTEQNSVETNDLREIIRKASDILEHHFKLNNTALKLELPETEVIAQVDRDKIQQVLIALMVNSIEATVKNGLVTVNLHTFENNLEIRVIDNGCGIPEKERNKVFEPFYSTKTNRNGTGLGLSVAYGIITAHGGSISIENSSNFGTTMLIQLPIHQSEK
ncbi:MAG: HAMP domain-containing protein [Ignavibacteriaceae bacterium]|nr:HAMP domain-containing protein [Ignavibacteriaceae bacterium]